MQVQDEFENLAAALLTRRTAGRSFVLLLGIDIGRAAGVPSLAETAHRVFRDLYQRDQAAARSYLREETLQQIEGPLSRPLELEVVEGFKVLLSGMSTLARYSLFSSYHNHLPIPRFYQDIARLIRDGFVNPILTTNLDTLLEEALKGFGLQRAIDYQVWMPENGEPKRRAESDPRIQILRISGELPPGRPESERAWISKALQRLDLGDHSFPLLASGYNFECQPLNEILTATRGPVWFAAPQINDQKQFGSLAKRREVHRIAGPTAEPEPFFGFLSTLLRLKTEHDDDAAELTETSEEASLEYTYLRDQLRRSRNVLADLEQQRAIRGGFESNVQAQIAYQQSQIYQLENRLQALEAANEHLVALIRLMARQAQENGADRNTYLYLRYQATAIRRELDQEKPNRDVIAAALDAAINLAKRLPAEMVEPELFAQLTDAALSNRESS